MAAMFGAGRPRRQLTSGQIIIMGFLCVILLGTLLLMLPWANQETGGAPFLDALFTATSAVCVTGLIVHDTATYWSAFGQAVILLLIQVGGMGVITVAMGLARLSGRRIGLLQRNLLQESISAPALGGIVRLTHLILWESLAIELSGAVLLYPAFAREFGLLRGIWYAVFHSVSAFCNAGFDLMGIRSPYASLTGFCTDGVVNVVIMLLIIIGGLGFLTWEDIRTCKWQVKKYRMQSKVTLTASAALIFLPFLYYFFLEFSRWDGMTMGQRVLTSLFQSVTPRTAGFNTVDLGQLSEVGRSLMIALMLVGGSPGSTAGGMKTTTLVVLLASAVAAFRRSPDTHLFHRRLPEETVRNAAALLLLYLGLLLVGGMVISYVEGVAMLTAFFEVASAIATVGLTLGLTPSLCAVSKLILIVCMFFGRIGGLTLIFAVFSGKRPPSRLPEERITVG